MAEYAPFSLKGFLKRPSGSLEPAEISIDPPTTTSQGSFRCNVRSSLLHASPHPVYSRLEHDAWAKAFALIHRMISFEGKALVDENGGPIRLPSPARDRACMEEERRPKVAGIHPIFHVEGWAMQQGAQRRRVELAIWPPYEEEHGTFCAPMRCGRRRKGEVMCSYGASPEQAVYLAYKYLQIEVDHYAITDDDGRLLDIPIPPEPPPIEAPIPTD